MRAVYVMIVVDPLRPGLVRVVRREDGASDQALWTVAKARKEHPCVVCRCTVPKGGSVYRPIGNQLYRYERICEKCMLRAFPNGRECPVCGDIQEDLSWDDCCDGPTDLVIISDCNRGSDCGDDEHHFGIGKHVHNMRMEA